MRPVVRGDCPVDSVSGTEVKYKDYSYARAELITRMGEFCSYCEMRLDSSLAVEHVKPKKPPGAAHDLPEREFCWDNFLLACANCNSTKGNTDVILGDYFWPDRDNTFIALSYSEGGLVTPAEELDPTLRTKAQKMITLTGLDKHPLNDPQDSDRRWRNRRETWDIAMESKNDLVDSDTPQMRRQIVRTVNGYWSVWMTIFKDDPDMISRFIDAFPGTCKECFDANGQPLSRTGGQI